MLDAQWQNATRLDESATTTRDGMLRFAHNHADSSGLVMNLVFISSLAFVHARYCVGTISGRSYKAVDARLHLRIWGSQLFIAIPMYVFTLVHTIVMCVDSGMTNLNVYFVVVCVLVTAIHAKGFVIAKRLANEHGISMHDAYDIDLVRWLRPRVMLPT